jgi:hypothetical protein
MRCTKSRRFVIRVVTWSVTGACVAFAILGLGLTFFVGLMGGPAEPPSGMSFDDFMRWRDSGQWWRDAVWSDTKWAIIPIIVACVITLVTMLGRDKHYDVA